MKQYTYNNIFPEPRQPKRDSKKLNLLLYSLLGVLVLVLIGVIVWLVLSSFHVGAQDANSSSLSSVPHTSSAISDSAKPESVSHPDTSHAESSERIPDSSSVSEHSSVPSPDPVPTVPDHPEESQEALWTRLRNEIGSTSRFYSAHIPGYTAATEIPGLYSLGLDSIEPYQYTAQLCENYLYVTVYGDDMVRSVIDLNTGKVKGSFALSEMNTLNYGPLSGGRSYVVSRDLNLLIYRPDGGIEQSASFAALSPYQNDSLSLIAMTMDGKYLIIRPDISNEFLILSVNDGHCASLRIPSSTYLSVLRNDENGLVLSDYQHTIFTLHPESMQYETASLSSSISSGSSELHVYSDSLLLPVETAGGLLCMIPMHYENEAVLDVCGGMVAVSYDYNQNYSADGVLIYDLYAQKSITLPVPSAATLLNAQFTESGSLLVVYEEDDLVTFAFADLSELKQDDYAFSLVSDLDQETAKLAAQAKEQFGISLYYGSAGNDFFFGDYIGAAVLDPLVNYRAVSKVLDILSLFPEGMFREAYEGLYEGFDLYLCGNIYGVGYAGLSTSGGCTNIINNRIVIALNLNEPYAFNLPHELAHAFDYRLSSELSRSGISLNSDWTKYSPEDGYLFSYAGYESLYEYILDLASPENVWFVRNYSRTFPGEDRATLMERMFLHDNGSDCNEAFYHEHLRNKAQHYCSLLRSCFASCKNADTLYWEQGLT